MAYSIAEAASVVNSLLQAARVGIDGDELAHLSEHGDALIGGFRCKIANVLTLTSARVLVNTSWFDYTRADYSKPRMQHGTGKPGIDFQLIPTKTKLFAVHYLELRQHALGLEKERDHWFTQSYWGVQVDEQGESFTWTGGNSLKFPLLQLTRSAVLRARNSELFERICSS